MYQIVFRDEVLKEDLPKLPKTILKLVKKAINERLETDPISYGKPLRYSLKGHRRIRVSDYRIVYTIENNTVIITTIRHRKDVYE